MFLTRSEYDRGVNTFSPEGRLYQIEYANEAIKLGSTTIGISTKQGIVMAVEKRITSSLLEPAKIEKIVEIDKHIGCATSGLIADARTLLDRARVECQNHWFLYDEPMPVESCAQAVSNLAFQFGDSDEAGAMSRPFGVALLFAGIYKNLPELWYMDPSGTYVKYKAKAIGSGSESAEEDLRTYVKDRDLYIDLTLSEAVNVALTTLKRIMEDTLTSQNVEIMRITPKTENSEGGFQMLTKEEIEAEIQKLP